MTAPTSADTLHWLIQLLGPDAVALMSRPPTVQESADIEAVLARHDGDPVTALGINLDTETAAYVRSLPVGTVR